MENKKKIAIYLDHSTANSIEYTNTAHLLSTVKLEFDPVDKKKVLQKGESHLHDKEQHLQQQFYKKISNSSIGFPIVLLFGPTTAKAELENIFTNDNRFSDVDVMLKITDKLDPKEQIDYVNNFFNTSKNEYNVFEN
jgi:hypothetical protein